jgi:hypothetical protein
MIHIVCLPDSSERDVVNPRLNPKFMTFLIRSVRLCINHILRNPPQAHLKAVSVFQGRLVYMDWNIWIKRLVRRHVHSLQEFEKNCFKFKLSRRALSAAKNRKASGLCPTQTLCGGLAQLGRTVGQTMTEVTGRAAGIAVQRVFQGGLHIYVYILWRVISWHFDNHFYLDVFRPCFWVLVLLQF